MSCTSSVEISPKIDPRIVSALSKMHSLNPNQLSIDEVARSVNLSESRFRSLFTIHVGVTPARYLKLMRLQQADQLVQETFMTIKEVMAATGFNDASHFLRDYKACYGCTPSLRRRRRFGQ